MFESLSERLQGIFKSLRGQGVLSEAQVDAALREIRLALLEADVHFKVAKQIVDRVRARATGQDVLKSLTPDQAVLRVVRDEMVAVLGGAEPKPLESASRPPTVILMTGLQGSGKTTTTAKLGRWLAGRGRHPLARVDRRPAAGGARAAPRRRRAGGGEGAPPRPGATRARSCARPSPRPARWATTRSSWTPPAASTSTTRSWRSSPSCARSRSRPRCSTSRTPSPARTRCAAPRSSTAASASPGSCSPSSTATRGAGPRSPRPRSRGGPVKFAGVGEKVDALEPFDPARMVSRILGMGDVLGLIAMAEETVEREQAEELARKLRRAEFTLEDYRDQMKQLRKMGPLDQVLSMIPGAGSLKGVDVDRGERELRRTIAIIDSMTPQERREPSVINGSRRKRIARGSGSSVEDVNRLLKQFAQAQEAHEGARERGRRR